MSIEQRLQNRERFDTNKFSKELPSSRIRNASVGELPDKAVALFDSRISMRTFGHRAGEYDSRLVIDHQVGDTTYVVQKKVTKENGSTMDWIYLFDEDQKGQTQGYGELVHSTNGKPFVGYTLSEVKKQGLGQRRLEMMNALSSMLYDKPLHSGFTISDPARGVWEKLVHEGMAEKYVDGETQRYVFLE